MIWLGQHWEFIAAALAALISIGNAITAHWSQSTGWVRWVKLAVELLSVLTSKGTRAGQGPLAALKLPGQSVPPVVGYVPKPAAKVPSRVVALAAILALGASGCAAWPEVARKGLTHAHEAGKAARAIVVPTCDAAVQACVRQPCPALDRCRKVITALLALQEAVRAGLVAIDAYERIRGDLEAMGVKP